MGLTTKSSLEKTAMRILGEDFSSLATFFLKIYELCLTYEKNKKPVMVAFVTRRCHVLSLIYQSIFSKYSNVEGEQLPEYLKKDFSFKDYLRVANTYFTTDTNLVCMGEKIASYYMREKEFPHIILVDEMLLHGRTLNHILTEMEQDIQDYVQSRSNVYIDDISIEREFLSKLELHVFIQNDEPLLLLSRYQKRLWADSIRPVGETRERSKQFALLVSVGTVNNDPWSWSISRHEMPEPTGILKDKVRKVTTTCSQIRQNTYFWPYPNETHPKALFTFRWKHSNLSPHKADICYLGVPFLVAGNISSANAGKLYSAVYKDFSPELKTFSFRYLDENEYMPRNTTSQWRRITELNNLVLCGLFARCLYGDSLTVQDLDLEMLARNFTNFTGFLEKKKDTEENVQSELTALWAFTSEQAEKKLASYLEILLQGVSPLWKMKDDSGEGLSEVVKGLLQEVVNNEVSEIGYQTEQNARNIYRTGSGSNEERLSNWGTTFYLEEKIKELILDYQFDQLSEVYTMMAMLLQRMDLGFISIVPSMAGGEYSKEIGMELRAGEQSLFIKPTVYQKYIPVLSKIVDRCRNSWPEVEREIDRFVERLRRVKLDVDEGLAIYLKLFLYQLNSVDQTPGDWDFPLTDSVPKWEFDGEEVTQYEPGQKLLKTLREQQELMQIYNQI